MIVCITILVVFAIGVALQASGSKWTAGVDAWKLGGDFVELYSAGRVLNDHNEDRLYDVALEEQLNRELIPGATSLKRAFAYPPFVAILFQPFAHLSFDRGLVAFLTASALMYLCAVLLLIRQFGPEARDEQALMLVAGLSFFPFIGYTWLGAQISVIGLASVALALCAEDRGRPFSSGLALSMCLYKPSLLVLMGPMMIVTGKVRQLAGFATGGAALALLCILYTGVPATVAFLDKLTVTLGRAVAATGLFNAYRYVDLNAFFRLLPYGRSTAGWTVLVTVSTIVAAALVRMWLRSRHAGRAERLLVWSATLTWTLVLNVYVPFYDTVLIVPAAVLAVAAVRERNWLGWNRLAPALLMVYATSWIAEGFARTFRLQIYTLVLGGFGLLLLVEAYRRQSQARDRRIQALRAPRFSAYAPARCRIRRGALHVAVSRHGRRATFGLPTPVGRDAGLVAGRKPVHHSRTIQLEPSFPGVSDACRARRIAVCSAAAALG